MSILKAMVVAVAAGALVLGTATPASARSKSDAYYDCIRVGYSMKSCCQYAGGSYYRYWVNDWGTGTGHYEEQCSGLHGEWQSQTGSTSGTYAR